MRTTLRVSSSVLGLESLEGRDGDVLHKRVELLLGILILVLLSADSDTDLSGDVSDASAPHKPVQAGVNTNLLDSKIIIRYSYISNL